MTAKQQFRREAEFAFDGRGKERGTRDREEELRGKSCRKTSVESKELVGEQESKMEGN